MDMVNEDEVTEVEGIKLASSVQVGDLGSIIFPAAKALLSWLRHHEYIESKYVLGNQGLQRNSSLKTASFYRLILIVYVLINYHFQSWAVERG